MKYTVVWGPDAEKRLTNLWLSAKDQQAVADAADAIDAALCRNPLSAGRIEERVDLRDTKKNGFDHLAVVVFFPDFRVKGAVLIPYGLVWPVIENRKYRRISFSEAKRLTGSIDISDDVSRAAAS